MKARQKKVLAVSSILGAVALVATLGTWAYFTYSTEPRKNEFKIGKVEVKLYESQFLSDASNNTNWNKIKTDDTTYNNTNGTGCATGNKATDCYLWRNAQNLVPGLEIAKAAYIENLDDSSDAYVRLKVLVPVDLVDNELITFDNFINEDASDLYETEVSNIDDWEDTFEDDDGNEFYVYTFTYNEVLKPGKHVVMSPVNAIAIDKHVNQNLTSEESEDWNMKVGEVFSISYIAEAIQAKGLGEDAEDAVEAFELYDDQVDEYPPQLR